MTTIEVSVKFNGGPAEFKPVEATVYGPLALHVPFGCDGDVYHVTHINSGMCFNPRHLSYTKIEAQALILRLLTILPAGSPPWDEDDPKRMADYPEWKSVVKTARDFIAELQETMEEGAS